MLSRRETLLAGLATGALVGTAPTTDIG